MSEDGSTDENRTKSWENVHYRSREPEVSREELHRILASPRRRALLSYVVSTRATTFSIDELVDVVAESEPPELGPASHRESIEIDLHHVHLPRLVEAGILTRDTASETVQYTGSKRLEFLLTSSETIEVQR